MSLFACSPSPLCRRGRQQDSHAKGPSTGHPWSDHPAGPSFMALELASWVLLWPGTLPPRRARLPLPAGLAFIPWTSLSCCLILFLSGIDKVMRNNDFMRVHHQLVCIVIVVCFKSIVRLCSPRKSALCVALLSRDARSSLLNAAVRISSNAQRQKPERGCLPQRKCKRLQRPKCRVPRRCKDTTRRWAALLARPRKNEARCRPADPLFASSALVRWMQG